MSGAGTDNIYKKVQVVNAMFEVWAGSGTGNAPTLPYNTIGFDLLGISTGIVYTYDSANDTWTTTTQTVAGFFGV